MIFTRTKPNKKSVEIADKIISGELYVHGSWPTVKFDKIEWNEDPYKDITWCFYLHSLDIVGYLMNAYELKPNEAYLKKSEEIIRSWIKANPSKENQKSFYAWKDHSVANRIVNMIQFWMSYKESALYTDEFKGILMQSLAQHGDYLELDQNHTFINNHGIFQDRSLIELAVLFPEFPNADKWYNKAINRFMLHVKKDVAKSGVHLEHSDAYHLIVMRLFSSINEFLNFHNRPTKDLTELIYKMEEFLGYALKPDMRIPTNGDSGPDTINSIRKEDIRNPHLLYVKTKGKEGEMPELNKLYKDSGYAFIRNNWNVNQKQLYLRLLAGFHSRVHKHADDLSVLLSIGNTDFFVDSGKYNYKEKDPFRQYFRSTIAHNTITVDRKTYPIEDKLIGKSKITELKEHEKYVLVHGQHNLYPGVIIKRSILYLKDTEAILLFDQIKSNKERTYTQTFNVGENVDLIPLGKKRCLLESKLDGKMIELRQINHVTEFKSFRGSTDPIAGWYSAKFNEKSAISQLQFTNKGVNLDYRTIINTDINKGVKYYSVNQSEKELVFKITYKNNITERIII